jgi:hypothetical protein
MLIELVIAGLFVLGYALLFIGQNPHEEEI